MHKGFKCLEPATGRVYISRDVVFDESVYPFANLHPNVGAQLRKEILLPENLVNSAGASNDYDQTVSPNPANQTVATDQDIGQNPNPFMLNGTPLGAPITSTRPRVDPPAPGALSDPASGLGTGAAPAPTDATVRPTMSATLAAPPGLLSAPTAPSASTFTPLVGSAAPAGDPLTVEPDPGVAAAPSPTTAAESSTPNGSDAPHVDAPATTQQQQRPATRLQHGIQKP